MTRKEAFAKIKQALFGNEQEFGQAKLTDGTVVMWEGDLAVGTALYVLDEAGTQQAAPDGEHTLEDGTVVSVAGGLVADVKPKDQEQEKEIEIEMAGELETMVQKMAEELASMKTKMAELEAMWKPQGMSSEEVESKLNEFTTNVEAKFNQVVELVGKIAEEPAAAPIEEPRQTFRKKASNSVENLSKYLQEIKK